MSEKLEVTLAEDVVALINAKLDEGTYSSSSEVLSAAMRALTREDEERQATIAYMRERVRASLDDPRPPVPMKEAFERVEAMLRLHADKAP